MILGIDIKIDHGNNTVSLYKSRYSKILSIVLKWFQKRGRALAMDPDVDFYVREEPFNILYQESIGTLMYLIVRKIPDLALSVCNMTKSVERPVHVHGMPVKRVLRYVTYKM